MRFEFAPAELPGGVVAKLSRNRRLALRFFMYIKALGVVPLPYQGQALEAYAIALQKQYESLRHEFGPEASRVALIAGRAAIKERGFGQLAAEFPLSLASTAKKRKILNKTEESPSAEPSPQTAALEFGRSPSRNELYNCRRKFRHTNILSALLHARRLNEDGLHIYACDLCDGLHVGHAPSAIDRRRRRIAKKLRELGDSIKELERTRNQLLRQRDEIAQDCSESCHNDPDEADSSASMRF